MRHALVLTVTFLLSTSFASAEGSFAGRTRFDLDRTEIQAFVESTAAANKMQPLDIYRLLAKAEPQPTIIELMSKPAEKVSPWWEYRERFLTEQRINEGAQFMREHRARLEQAQKDTGVAPEYVVAIIGVETFYGRITGKHRVLDALATLAFDYPPRAEFFRSELAQFIALAREEAVDPLTAMGSYAGAMGAGQFMPSSYRRYAVDGSDDDKRNLFADWDDIIASVANYFKENGWVAGGPVLAEAVVQPDAPATAEAGNLQLNDTVAGLKAKGVDFVTGEAESAPALLIPAETQVGPSYRVGFKNFEVITRYNRSVRYAMAVHDLATNIADRVAAAARCLGRNQARRAAGFGHRGPLMGNVSRVALAMTLTAFVASGCSLAKRPTRDSTRANIPSGSAVPQPPLDVFAIPDAVPRAEPRGRRGNPPFYEVFGKRYYVLASSEGFVERGTASWYGPGFHAASTSLGEPYDMYAMTAAHKTLPIPAYAEVTNLKNGRKVVVRINDRGPFVGDRIIDLSYTAAARLDMLLAGTAPVEVRVITARGAGSALPPASVPTPVAPALPPVTVVNAPAVKIPGAPAMFIQAGVFADHENARRRVEVLLAAGHRAGESGRGPEQRTPAASRARRAIRQRRRVRPQHETPARTRHQRRPPAHRLTSRLLQRWAYNRGP